MSAVLDDTIFRSYREALSFAFNFTHGTIKRPMLATLAGGPSKPGRGLGGLDGAAQAGMIKAEVLKLPNVRRYILTGRYARPHSPCDCRRPCCSRLLPNAEWVEAVEWLNEHIMRMALAGTVSNFRLRRALVVRYLGHEMNLSRVAQECGVHRDTASEHNKRVVAYLTAEERQAELEIDAALHVAGVVG